jgi:hypothetical protein
MKAHYFLTSLILLILLILIAGCSGKPIRINQQNQNIQLGDVDFTKGRDISASASGFQLLLFFPISINDRHERAFQTLRGQASHDYITDVKIQDSWTYAFVGTVYTTTIEAKAYPLRTKR